MEDLEFQGFTFAIEGCLHGELEKVYETMRLIEGKNETKIDALLCCGDFQSIRNYFDMENMACPKKYQKLGEFNLYYSGKRKAPYLTIFIGGNHEASNYLKELEFGGWVAPNIYYLGRSGVINISKGGKKIRLAGLSGIYNDRDFFRDGNGKLPLDNYSKRSVYHYNERDIYTLQFLRGKIDIFLSHDWPQDIYFYGRTEALLNMKPYFSEEIQTQKLGSPGLLYLMKNLKPKYWFSAHLHVKFPAMFYHEDGSDTKFLALDKCLPRRKFLQIFKTPIELCETTEEPNRTQGLSIEYDLEWLSVVSAMEREFSRVNFSRNLHFYTLKNLKEGLVINDKALYISINEKIQAAKMLLLEKLEREPDALKIKDEEFIVTAKFASEPRNHIRPDKVELHPQTRRFMELASIDSQNFREILYYSFEKPNQTKSEFLNATGNENNEEMSLSMDDEEVKMDDEQKPQEMANNMETCIYTGNKKEDLVNESVNKSITLVQANDGKAFALDEDELLSAITSWK